MNHSTPRVQGLSQVLPPASNGPAAVVQHPSPSPALPGGTPHAAGPAFISPVPVSSGPRPGVTVHGAGIQSVSPAKGPGGYAGASAPPIASPPPASWSSHPQGQRPQAPGARPMMGVRTPLVGQPATGSGAPVRPQYGLSGGVGNAAQVVSPALQQWAAQGQVQRRVQDTGQSFQTSQQTANRQMASSVSQAFRRSGTPVSAGAQFTPQGQRVQYQYQGQSGTAQLSGGSAKATPGQFMSQTLAQQQQQQLLQQQQLQHQQPRQALTMPVAAGSSVQQVASGYGTGVVQSPQLQQQVQFIRSQAQGALPSGGLSIPSAQVPGSASGALGYGLGPKLGASLGAPLVAQSQGLGQTDFSKRLVVPSGATVAAGAGTSAVQGVKGALGTGMPGVGGQAGTTEGIVVSAAKWQETMQQRLKSLLSIVQTAYKEMSAAHACRIETLRASDAVEEDEEREALRRYLRNAELLTTVFSSDAASLTFPPPLPAPAAAPPSLRPNSHCAADSTSGAQHMKVGQGTPAVLPLRPEARGREQALINGGSDMQVEGSDAEDGDQAGKASVSLRKQGRERVVGTADEQGAGGGSIPGGSVARDGREDISGTSHQNGILIGLEEGQTTVDTAGGEVSRRWPAGNDKDEWKIQAAGVGGVRMATDAEPSALAGRGEADAEHGAGRGAEDQVLAAAYALVTSGLMSGNNTSSKASSAHTGKRRLTPGPGGDGRGPETEEGGKKRCRTGGFWAAEVLERVGEMGEGMANGEDEDEGLSFLPLHWGEGGEALLETSASQGKRREGLLGIADRILALAGGGEELSRTLSRGGGSVMSSGWSRWSGERPLLRREGMDEDEAEGEKGQQLAGAHLNGQGDTHERGENVAGSTGGNAACEIEKGASGVRGEGEESVDDEECEADPLLQRGRMQLSSDTSLKARAQAFAARQEKVDAELLRKVLGLKKNSLK